MYIYVRNSLSQQYKFTISLLLKDLYGALNLIKNNYPKSGKLLEFMYVSRGMRFNKVINDFEIDKNLDILKFIDCCMNSLYTHSQKCRKSLFQDCNNVAKLFHLTENELEYFYFISAVCYIFESEFDEELKPNELFSEEQLINLNLCVVKLKENIKEFVRF